MDQPIYEMPKSKQSKYSKAVRKLIAERREFPSDKFVRQYHPRSDATRALIGLSRRSATEQQLANRELYRVRGNGAYSVGRNWRKFSQGVGLTSAGRQLVSAGAGAGSAVIGAAGRMFGKGSYHQNSLITTGGMSDDVPMVSGTGDETGSIIVTRREFLQDVFAPQGGVSFVNRTFNINPGLETSFPWLAQIAQNYEEYELLQCIYTYRSTTTDIGSSTNGQCGTVIMATQYNVSNPPFSDKGSMMEYSGAMSCKTTESMMHGVECDPRKLSDPGHYVRAGPPPTGHDVSQYDHAVLNLAIANSPTGYANQVIGELWVSYTIKLKVPKLFVNRGLGIQKDIFVSGSYTSAEGAVVTAMGTQATLLAGQCNSIGCTVELTSPIDITVKFPSAYSGYVEIFLCLEDVTTTTTAMTSTPITMGNVRAVKDIYAGGGSGSGPSPDFISSTRGPIHTNGKFHMLAHYEVRQQTGGNQNSITFRFVSDVFPSVPKQAMLTITEYNYAFSSRTLGTGFSDAPILINPEGTVVTPA